MRTRTYTTEQLNFFPVYASTASVNFLQKLVDRPMGYNMHQIFLVSSGSGMLTVEDKTYFIEENDLFYISANTPHSYSPIDKNFSTTYISFLGTGFKKIEEYYSLKNHGVFKQKSRGKFFSSAKKLYEVLDAVHEVSHLCALTFSAIIAFFDEAYRKQHSPIEQVYNYLESNYHKMITLDDILAIFPYSKAKLCRDFKNKYDMTIFQVLTNIRLQHAQYMLKDNPHLKLKTVASLCGFSDVSYFCKMYKKAYMCSPKNEV